MSDYLFAYSEQSSPLHIFTEVVDVKKGESLLSEAKKLNKNCALVLFGFKPSICFFDMDATTVKEESLDLLAEKLGVADSVEAITAKAMSGELDFEEAFKKRVKLLAGAPQSLLEESARELTLTSGMKELAQFFIDLKIPCFLLSGGVDAFVGPIAHQLKFNGFRCNHLCLEQNKINGSVRVPIFDAQAKATAVEDLCEEYQVSLQKAIYVGDGANDLPAMKKVGLPVGFNPKPILIPTVNVYNSSSDHRFLLKVLEKTSAP